MKNTPPARGLKSQIPSVGALFLGLILVFPVIYCICAAFRSPAELFAFPPRVLPASFFNLENFRRALHIAPIPRFMLNSLIVSGIGCLLRVGFALLAAYGFAYFQFWGRKPLFMLLLGAMMLPPDTLMVTNYLTVSRLGLLNTYLGMCIAALTGGSQMFILRQNFKTIPRAMRDAALIDGCGDLAYIWYVALPVSRPVVFTLLVQSFIFFWNSYMWPLLVTTRPAMHTVQVGVTMLTSPLNTDFSIVMAAITMLLVPSFVLFVFLRRSFIDGVMTGSISG
jgi:sn-glycerol 3-phosphate transport system permease protein